MSIARSLTAAFAVAALSLALGALGAAPAGATWSIVVTDRSTGEVAVGSATCVSGIDLRALTPVVLVGLGGGAAQSVADGSGVNRRRIWDGLLAGLTPEEILDVLADADGLHQSRQYGIADVAPNPEVTFTGSNAGGWAGGVVGELGNLSYAIQGNLLTGEPVVARAEQAFRGAPGDVPMKLMASMFAAYKMGGDGRCSCSPFDPEGCGSPPPDFEKSAHVGYMLVARRGDTDGGCDAVQGCASGDYYLELNVPFDGPGDPDPVLQLRDQFVEHRRSWIGRPDHYRSAVVFQPPMLPADGQSMATGGILLRDFRGRRLTGGGADIEITLDPSSTAEPRIGPVTDRGDGTYTFPVRAPEEPGIAIFRVQVDDGEGPVLLAPFETLVIE